MTDLAEGLTEALRPFGAPEASGISDTREPAKPWRIEEDGGAEWALRRLALARAATTAVQQQHQAFVEKLTEWAAAASERPRRDEAYFNDLLVDYLRRRNEANPDVKSIKLPSGEVRSRLTGSSWIVTDEPALVDYLQASAPSVLDVRPRLKKAAANDLLVVKGDRVVGPDGDIVPGVEVVPERRSVTVHTELLS